MAQILALVFACLATICFLIEAVKSKGGFTAIGLTFLALVSVALLWPAGG